MRRHVLYAVAPACLLLGLPVAARADIAPIGSASSTAAQIGSLAGVSTTGATADGTSADAEASVIEVGGEPLLGTGGSQAATGQSGGALVDTGSTLPAQVELAPWQASASGSAADSTRSSTASAAVARAAVPDVAEVGVLQSESSAEHRSTRSTGAGSSDAADVAVADVARLVLLHSEVTSEGRGHSYLVGLNGTEIGTDEQLGGLCAVEAGELVALSCLKASGGLAGGLLGGNAEVLGVTSPVVAALDPVSAFSTTASSGTGTETVLGATETSAPTAETARDISPAAAAPASDTAGQAVGALPRTGVAAAALAAAALAALVSGGALRLLGRRRVTA